MDQKVFQEFREIIHRESGINLSEEKRPLLSNRMAKRIRSLGLKDEADYLQYVRNDRNGEELVELLDAISTNVTYFYREDEHFKILSDIFSSWKAESKRRVRMWCAAASSGEEPYTLAITAAEKLDLARLDYKFLATDICTQVLNHGATGLYDEKQFKQMPDAMKAKYFTRTKGRTDSTVAWQASPALREQITFKRLNLAQFPYPLKGPLDVIFCRNVMIYFDNQLRQKIVREFERLLAPGGYLFVSRSENLLGLQTELKSIGTSVYQKGSGA